MKTWSPRVSIGLPVYNGAKTLARAIQSYLDQTFEDFELIVSDNGSDDDSDRICREFARSDPRVRFYRYATNQGAVANFNRVFRLANGEYFKWAAHDDWCSPQLLSRCVEGLDADPTAVLCQSQASLVHEDDRVIRERMDLHEVSYPDPVDRFHHVLWRVKYPYVVFGLIRRRAMAATDLLTRDVGSDRIMLARLSLVGKFRQVPEVLFFVSQTTSARVARNSDWWTPQNVGRPTLMSWRLAAGFSRAVIESGLSTADKGFLLADIAARYGMRDLARLPYELYLGAGEVLYRKPYNTVPASGGSYLRRWRTLPPNRS